MIVDRYRCLHPMIQSAIQDKKCTTTITGTSLDYGQLLFTCITCGNGRVYCAVCKEACHLNSNEHEWQEKWFYDYFCDCATDATCCAKSGNSCEPKLKKQKVDDTYIMTM